MRTSIVLIVLFALGRWSDAVAQPAPTGILTGIVVSAETGRPIANAAIRVEGTSAAAQTNGAGRFRLEAVPVGQAVLLVDAPGFTRMRVPNVNIQPGSTSPLSVEMAPALNVLEHVQVTATKEPVSIGDIGAQTSVIDRSAIESRGDQTLTQAIAHTPGAVVSTQLGIFESVMLRGMPRGDPEFTNTLLLVDGVPQTLSNNGARVVALPITDASSIEIVRGPGSALYGRTAIGGAVNVITADPTATRQAELEFTGGELGLAKGAVRVSGPLSHWGGYYLSGGAERNGGYFVNKTSQDFSDNTKSVFGKVTFAPDGHTFGSISLNHVDSRNSTPTNEPIVDGQLLHLIDPRFQRFTNFNIPGPNYNQRETRLTTSLTRVLTGSVNLVETFGYRKVQHRFVDDGDFIAGPFDLDAHTVSMYPFSQQTDENIFYEELRLEVNRRSSRMKNALTIGGSYERNGGKLFSDFIYNDPDLFGFTINYLNPVIPPRAEWQHDTGHRDYHLGITGLFGQYILEPASRVVLMAGGRYDRLNLDNRRDDGDRIDDTFDAFSPKVSATFRVLTPQDDIRPVLNIYGAYSESFLPPRRPSSLLPDDVPLNLKPENIVNYETGLKGSLAGGRVTFEATYFHMGEDGVVLTTRQGPFFLPTNVGKLRYKGVETGGSVAVSSKVSFYGNASFYRNRFGDFVIESEDGDERLTGNKLPISPDRVINWGVTVRQTPAIEATLNVKHLGEVQANRENTFRIEPYSVVDAAISWRRGALRFTLSAHNLLNADYYWNADGETADPGRPRQLLLTTQVQIK